MQHLTMVYQPLKKKRRWRWPVFLITTLLIAIFFRLFTHSPSFAPELTKLPNAPGQPQPQLPWPSYGQSAVGAQGYGVLDVNSTNQKPQPTASVAKVMTALAVLKAHPLNLGEQGPMVPITDQDVTTFNDYLQKDGSVTKVVAGEQISEYQSLQAMLISSSNNMADTLARWAYGSVDSYADYANSLATQLGMNSSHFVDGSGFNPQTVSTAHDLVLLGEQAMGNPVIAQIVSQWQADIPVAGTIQSTNLFLDYQNDGVIGIKTGQTDQAGGCFLVAAKYSLDKDHSVVVIGAVLGAPTHFGAQEDAMKLIQTTHANFHVVKLVAQGQTVGQYALPWGSTINAVAQQDVNAILWGTQTPKVIATLKPLRAPTQTDEAVGNIAVDSPASNTDVILQTTLNKPTWSWRLRHFWRFI